MARLVAFAMHLPMLSAKQEERVRRYGAEACEEMRIMESGGGSMVAGILSRPFKTKKVAQSSFATNFKTWEITRPKHVNGWYRELSLDEYFAEFAEVPRVLGRKMQVLVSNAVDQCLHLGYCTAMDRAGARLAKAQCAKEKKEKGERKLAQVDQKLKREIFEVFAATRRNLQREQKAMHNADLDSKWSAMYQAEQEKEAAARKATADYAELMKCPKFREKVDLTRIEEQKKEQTRMVAYHVARKEEEKKRQEAEVAPETKKRRIEQIREWP
jgi:hypothetical protein